MEPKKTEISFSSILSQTSTPNKTSIENNKMEQLMKSVETLNGQIKIEVHNYKKKCEDQETMISSMKKCLHMDILETDFETYKQDMTMKIKSLEDEKVRLTTRIKSLEDEKCRIQNEKTSLQRKYNSIHRELTGVKSLHSYATSSQTNLQKKIDDLTKQLESEKALRKKAEDKWNSLESQLIALNKIGPKTAVSQTTSVKVLPTTLTSQTASNKVVSTTTTSQTTANKVVPTTTTSQTLDKAAPNNQTNGKPVIPHPATVVSDSKSTTVTNRVTENNPLVKPSLASEPLAPVFRASRSTRKRKANYVY